ncbi:uncharacterized protein LOC109808304 isoform X2 [Cajanus cajan]|uniref:uncharacterized protein LOC109808304 isoform X2 n=1 Tax=Cajanus cajan TaxID=3821 RepID=UPI00098D9D9A|nr:uncharacterized protein LOC109808304 isoform X2 [Cajanus cajan]
MTSFRVSATLVCDGLMINLKVGEVGEEAWGAALCDVEERVTEIASITQGHSWSHSNFSSSCSQQNSQRQQFYFRDLLQESARGTKTGFILSTLCTGNIMFIGS